MAFVRRKGKFHYLVESRRDGGRVRQVTIAYLGEWPTVTEAIASIPSHVAELRADAVSYEARAATYQQELGGGPVPVPRPHVGSRTHRRLIRSYWFYQGRAKARLLWAHRWERQLEKLRAFAGGSAHESCAGAPLVGTTAERKRRLDEIAESLTALGVGK